MKTNKVISLRPSNRPNITDMDLQLGGTPPGGSDLEARVARLESDVEYIKRDISELKADMRSLKDDVSTIKHRLAYLAGAAFILVAGLAWVANNRFDQVLNLLTK